jgi:hypothetical protein
MLLDCSNSEAIPQIAKESGWGQIGELRFSGATLAGVVELGRAAFCEGTDECQNAERCLTNLPSAQQALRTTVAMLGGEFDNDLPQSHLFSAPTWELWLVRGPSCIESSEFSLFANRFQRSLAQSGFGLRFPYVLSQALIEMTENVVRHSAKKDAAPALGLVGYHVVPGAMNYIVADLGRGVLQSLNDNQKWRKLKTEADALVAAAKDGATRLADQTAGDGFRVAFQGFLDRDGVLAMRSGDGVVRLHGNMNGREAEIGNAVSIPGLRVCGQCMLSGNTGEIELPA